MELSESYLTHSMQFIGSRFLIVAIVHAQFSLFFISFLTCPFLSFLFIYDSVQYYRGVTVLSVVCVYRIHCVFVLSG